MEIKQIQIVTKFNNERNLLLEAFFSGRSKRTVEAYKADLKAFSEYLNHSDSELCIGQILQSSQVEVFRHVLFYKNWMLDKGMASNTINRRLAAIRSLMKLAHSLGIISFELSIPNIKVTLLRDTRGPRNFEIQKIFRYLDTESSPRAIRNRAIIRMLFDLALRASELVNLDMSDFDETNKRVFVLGKGKREKVPLTLPELTFQALKDWIYARGTFPGPLFINFQRGAGNIKRLSRQGLRDLVIDIAKKSGVSPKTTHSWRHSSITQAIIKAQENGMGIELVLDHSRHSKSSLNLLMTYRDRHDNFQGKIADLISKQVG
jgi:integrase/recombinase XerC